MLEVPAVSGLYFVRLYGDELVSVNQNDAKRRDLCILVNSLNCKYGKTVNLRARYKAYCRTFGAERLRFTVLALSDQASVLERQLHRYFRPYRMRGSTGRLNEWLENINSEQALADALKLCCSDRLTDVREMRNVAPLTLLQNSAGSKTQFIPDDIVQLSVYLREHGMSEHLLGELHHFGSQTYAQTVRYFSGKSRIQGKNNPRYAARLDFVVKGHARGGQFPDLVRQAVREYPHAEE